MLSFIQTQNFFGYLGDMDIQGKKNSVLQTYKFLYRFSIEKLLNYLKDDSYLVILMHYIKDTQLKRIHQRSVLKKNLGAYYRVIENMLNLGEKKSYIKACFNTPLGDTEASFIVPSDLYQHVNAEDKMIGENTSLHETNQIDEASPTKSMFKISLEPLRE